MKKFIIGSAIAASLGALTTIGFLIAIGVDYRMQEDRGIEPGYTPDVIVGGFEAGLWLLGVGIAALIVSSIVAILQRRNERAASSAPSH
ncbi:hypothetical protein ITJ50_03470 [Curtobacterium sp. VKM Ac-2889]|jgi:hypothetical protein|uniref:hypothetical protein n=1 Tax=unclassified Curtobacterium TaxID=257496 RepID=UPI00188A0C3A|nr:MULTISPECIES: hypothetical protein [unclassified Curtobacterium]MBF4598176.1 hypothetical protein [Curtobacterium sp. VKM Ac-1796]MBF4610271.1 hypothetical protein [Curtobacterium sp. VKM Ac-2889]